MKKFKYFNFKTKKELMFFYDFHNESRMAYATPFDSQTAYIKHYFRVDYYNPEMKSIGFFFVDELDQVEIKRKMNECIEWYFLSPEVQALYHSAYD